MSYDYWSKYEERVSASGSSTWREKVNLLGFTFFILIFLIGFFGVTDFLTLDLKATPHILRTSERNMLRCDIMEVNLLLIGIIVYPVAVFVLDVLFNGSIGKVARRRNKK